MVRELSPRPGGHRRTALAAAVAAGLVALVLTPGPARAQGDLVAADPPAGATLTAAPAEVALTFGAEVDETDSHVAVLDAAGARIVEEPARPSGGAGLRLPVRIDAAGDYTVAYHVTFVDGGTATGAHRFSVGTGRAPAPLDAAARQASTDAVRTHGHTVDGFSAFLLVVDGAVLVVVLALLWLRPRNGRRPMSLRAADPGL
ncbi:hypothetical protein AWW66_03700 [Micromonospora rosaria]|uniref:CopC domain-containing protein n=1 Tax=Micromonospora rosaria TaxID=47874 RepID=A0A136PYA3_9ACTN|nr:copper resistance CopC family protein [Micromonospora rosaria]KXK63422.1 hypothetical protein AWW66_03700 [Micromonospora rosaria]